MTHPVVRQARLITRSGQLGQAVVNDDLRTARIDDARIAVEEVPAEAEIEDRADFDLDVIGKALYLDPVLRFRSG